VGLRSVSARYRRAVEPSSTGLPRARVITVPLALLAAVFVVLVSLGLTGSSSGILQPAFSSGPDDRAVAGAPQAIRSDEWLVQTSWTISQVEQGLPVVNETFPGGWDATVQNDLPALDWSLAFKPHLWGFLVLPLDQALAFKWWLPGFSLIASVFLFAVTMMPRRPAASMALGVAVFYFPFMQWWFLPITFWPPALAFFIMTAVFWAVRGASRRSRVVLAAVTGYVAVTVGMSVYVPFIVASGLPALAFAVGALFDRAGGSAAPMRDRLRALVPLVVAGVAAVLFVVLWILTRWDTIRGFLSTVYPGQRVVETGAAGFGYWRALLAAPFTLSLNGGTTWSMFGGNPSEASTVPLVGLFLLIPLIWLAVRRYRADRTVDTILLATVVLLAFVLAFLVIPGWDALAHLTFIDRVPIGRLRLLFGIVSIVLIVLMVHRLDQWRAERDGSARMTVPAALGALVAAASIAGVWYSLARHGIPIDSGVYVGDAAVVMTLVLSLLTVLAVFFLGQGWASAGVAALLVFTVLGSGHVNPLYRGAFNINDTRLVQTMKQLQEESGDPDAAWVGVGQSQWPNAVLMQAGLPAFNGVQGAPSETMWEMLDPTGEDELAWNRLANVSWVAGEGDPEPRNPAPDQIQMTFDSCDDFAQENVDFVLSDGPLDQPCLVPLERVADGAVDFRLYEVAEVAP